MKHLYTVAMWLVVALAFPCAGTILPERQDTPKVLFDTPVGQFVVELFPDEAPITVDNFLQYLHDGFYDGLIIHRIEKSSLFKIVQGGGYKPGGFLQEEGLRDPIINESYNGLSNMRGTIAMARATEADSATSQWYINVTDNNSLDLANDPCGIGYAVFGQVLSGMQVVDTINQQIIIPPFYANGLDRCPAYNNDWVYVFYQQEVVYIGPSGDDTTGTGGPLTPLKTIQKGVDLIADGGNVILIPGTYSGAGNVDVDFGGRPMTVRAVQPRHPEVVTKTVIDCGGSSSNMHRAFQFYSGEDANSVVQGLHIKGGYHEYGGAINCQNSSPMLKNCVFSENTAEFRGGAVFAFNSSVTVRNCTFSRNTADLNGGAITLHHGSSGSILNSILWNNASPTGHEIALTGTVPSTVHVLYSDVEGGPAEVGIESGSTLDWGMGNIDIDPRFWDADNDDYHLNSSRLLWTDSNGAWILGTATSGCIDAGHPGVPPMYEFGTNNVRVNMGAHGGTTHASIPPKTGWQLTGDLDNNGRVDLTDFGHFGPEWFFAGKESIGDFNKNDNVRGLDLEIWCDDWLMEAAWRRAEKAEIDGDGTVTFKDFAEMAAQYGMSGGGLAGD